MELVKKIITGAVIIAVIIELMLPNGWPRLRRGPAGGERPRDKSAPETRRGAR